MRVIEYKCKGDVKSNELVLEYPKDKLRLEKYSNCGTVRKIQSARMKQRNKKGWQYLNLVATFDIETTTIVDTHEGFMYHWQMCIGEDVYVGRYWEEWLQLLKELREFFGICLDKLFVIYIHNLSFEFQFFNKFFNWETIFATKERQVLKCTTADGIEFRCSYKLSNMSLEKMCEQSKSCIHIKQKGDLDYNIYRTPKTPLSDKELAYCYGDVKGLAECIKDYLEEDTLATIPLTSTGFVRRDCRKAMSKNLKNRKDFLDMRMTEEIYILLKENLRGGNTHGSRYLSGRVLKNVRSFDVASSYPYVQCCKYFPMSKFKQFVFYNNDEFENQIEESCCLFRCVITDIKIKEGVPIPYIAFAKCRKVKNAVKFNGRILSADRLDMTLNEIDYQIIKSQYDIKGEIYVDKLYIAKRGMLPKELRDFVKYMYKLKTELKGGDSYYYMKSKNKINGIFGMICTDCVHDIISLTETGWVKNTESIQKALNKYYRNSNSFLTYAWGVWTTAQARLHLQKIVDITAEETVYVDTDSDKCINPPMGKIRKINDEIRKEAERYGAYADRNGKRYYMGVFEEETPYDKFITLGAKKYAYEQNGKLGITVSGVSKINGPKELKTLDNFRPGFEFKKAGGNVAYYNDMPIHYITLDGEDVLTASNVGLVERTYTLGVTEEFLEQVGINYLF